MTPVEEYESIFVFMISVIAISAFLSGIAIVNLYTNLLLMSLATAGIASYTLIKEYNVFKQTKITEVDK